MIPHGIIKNSFAKKSLAKKPRMSKKNKSSAGSEQHA